MKSEVKGKMVVFISLFNLSMPSNRGRENVPTACFDKRLQSETVAEFKANCARNDASPSIKQGTSNQIDTHLPTLTVVSSEASLRIDGAQLQLA
jgi:hypothetical protein